LLLLKVALTLLIVALLVVWATTLLARQRAPKQPKPAPGIDYSRMPVYGTKRWARMMYKNGNCTMEELVSWFAANPAAPED
jgi:hypothetical protein